MDNFEKVAGYLLAFVPAICCVYFLLQCSSDIFFKKRKFIDRFLNKKITMDDIKPLLSKDDDFNLEKLKKLYKNGSLTKLFNGNNWWLQGDVAFACLSKSCKEHEKAFQIFSMLAVKDADSVTEQIDNISKMIDISERIDYQVIEEICKSVGKFKLDLFLFKLYIKEKENKEALELFMYYITTGRVQDYDTEYTCGLIDTIEVQKQYHVSCDIMKKILEKYTKKEWCNIVKNWWYFIEFVNYPNICGLVFHLLISELLLQSTITKRLIYHRVELEKILAEYLHSSNKNVLDVFKECQ